MSKPVILCVDDEKIILDALKEQLKRRIGPDYRVDTAESGEAALEIIDELREDGRELPVVISDHIMPGIKGDELLIKIKDIFPRTRKILLTGQAGLEAVTNAVNRAGLYRYIAKPWEAEDLILTVREAIRGYDSDLELEQRQIELAELNDRLRARVDLFHRFVPAQFLKSMDIESENSHIALGECAEKQMTVLFSDIRSFTALAESLSPRDIFEFINQYLSTMTPIISEHGGFVDKYVGDAIMALFDNARDALRAGMAMIAGVEKVRRDTGRDINIGVGAHTGKLILGTVGEADRMQTTVLGDSVNLAARMESMTRALDTMMLVTVDTVMEIGGPEEYGLRFVDQIPVRGRAEPVPVFEVLDVLSPALKEKKIAIAPSFDRGRHHFYLGETAKAREFFSECARLCPEDMATKIYLERCEAENQ